MTFPMPKPQKPWTVSNSEGGGNGVISIEHATAASVNVVFAQLMMELGATVCSPAGPSCLLCPLRSTCGAYRDGTTVETVWLESGSSLAYKLRSVTDYRIRGIAIHDLLGDAVLARVHQEGAACHTGERSCFYRDLEGSAEAPDPE